MERMGVAIGWGAKYRAPHNSRKKFSGRVDCLHSRDTTATCSWKCPFFQGVGRDRSPALPSP